MQIILSTYQAKPSGRPGLFSIVMNIGQNDPDPLPQEKVEVKNATAALEAFEAYVEKAKAKGGLIACSMRAGEGRKAPGFDKAKATLPPFTIVGAD